MNLHMQRVTRLALLALGIGAAAAHAGSVADVFRIQMTITTACVVTAAPTDIDLGSVAAKATAVNVSGSTAIDVNCTKKTPFFIGLAPSDDNRNGSGMMRGQISGNSDRVPYRLYSNAALNRTWGNTATSTRRGNGMAGTGAGMAAADAVSFPAYAKVTNVNFRPDSYADTVTVNVHY
ncbi:MAG: Sigma-fimbriae tip adhesin [Burkholderiaceae bacterium]|jgi:spore coat protein U-like protein|nr:MAG: Sigma-fimbriae tip adhesin [Burkholderiaceae bacterium]